jgi:hypothetical protein
VSTWFVFSKTKFKHKHEEEQHWQCQARDKKGGWDKKNGNTTWRVSFVLAWVE